MMSATADASGLLLLVRLGDFAKLADARKMGTVIFHTHKWRRSHRNLNDARNTATGPVAKGWVNTTPYKRSRN
jgi:hypothetical protein